MSRLQKKISGLAFIDGYKDFFVVPSHTIGVVYVTMGYLRTMPRQIDLETWPRKPQYDFFFAFEEPFFGILVEVDCTVAMQYCKQHSLPFSWYYVNMALSVASDLEPWRYRIDGTHAIYADEMQGEVVTRKGLKL